MEGSGSLMKFPSCAWSPAYFTLGETTFPYSLKQFKWSFLLCADWSILTYALSCNTLSVSDIRNYLFFKCLLSVYPFLLFPVRTMGTGACLSCSSLWSPRPRIISRCSINIPRWMQSQIFDKNNHTHNFLKFSLLNHSNDLVFPILIYLNKSCSVWQIKKRIEIKIQYFPLDFRYLSLWHQISIKCVCKRNSILDATLMPNNLKTQELNLIFSFWSNNLTVL